MIEFLTNLTYRHIFKESLLKISWSYVKKRQRYQRICFKTFYSFSSPFTNLNFFWGFDNFPWGYNSNVRTIFVPIFRIPVILVSSWDFYQSLTFLAFFTAVQFVNHDCKFSIFTGISKIAFWKINISKISRTPLRSWGYSRPSGICVKVPLAEDKPPPWKNPGWLHAWSCVI